MASIEQARAALGALAAALGGADDQFRARIPDRSVTVELSDLAVAFMGQLRGGHLVEVHEIEVAQADSGQLRLRLHSDVLLALAAGELSFARAWATRRLSVRASWRDLAILRTFR